MDLYGLMLTHMRVNMFICVFDVFVSLGWPVSLPQALFSADKGVPGFSDYVNSGNYQNC